MNAAASLRDSRNSSALARPNAPGYSTPPLRGFEDLDLAWGGIVGGIGIKVGNMVPACCECDSGGSIADKIFPQAPVVASRG